MAKVILDSGNSDIISYFLDSHPDFDMNIFRNKENGKKEIKDANIKKLNKILNIRNK